MGGCALLALVRLVLSLLVVPLPAPAAEEAQLWRAVTWLAPLLGLSPGARVRLAAALHAWAPSWRLAASRAPCAAHQVHQASPGAAARLEHLLLHPPLAGMRRQTELQLPAAVACLALERCLAVVAAWHLLLAPAGWAAL